MSKYKIYSCHNWIKTIELFFLSSIPVINGLEKILCSYCPLLIYNVIIFICFGCTWLPQNPNNKILLGLKLQSWIRKNYRYFIFKRWIKSREGMEFLYDPNNIGGRIEKVKIKKTFENL